MRGEPLPAGFKERAQQLVKDAYQQLAKEFPNLGPMRIFATLQIYCEKFKWWS